MSGCRLSALARFFATTLLLNVRSGRALVYGYAVPVLFLIAFASVFRGETPALAGQMGQVLTISILGGACFGLPTALVAERERGVWRRYRLLPVSSFHLVATTVAARLVLVVSAVGLQIVLARLIYGTPWPEQWAGWGGAVLLVSLSFLGLGLLIAALADDVPAVQALGQCLFLPMILVGGVGIPLVALPEWAQVFSGFMPGRYAVDVLHSSLTGQRSATVPFSIGALLAIGAGAGVLGLRAFRWDATPVSAVRRAPWLGAAALAVWAGVGAVAAYTGQLRPETDVTRYAELSDADLARIRYDDLPGDNELVTRLAPPFGADDRPARVEAIAAALKTWKRSDRIVDEVRQLVAVAALADVGADQHEAEIARAVFDELRARHKHPSLRRALAWIILHPHEGHIITDAPELDLRRGKPPEKVVRERMVLYAKKYLGRLTGAIAAP